MREDLNMLSVQIRRPDETEHTGLQEAEKQLLIYDQ